MTGWEPSLSRSQAADRTSVGVDTRFNALDADRDLFQAELDLAQIRLNGFGTAAVVLSKRRCAPEGADYQWVRVPRQELSV